MKALKNGLSEREIKNKLNEIINKNKDQLNAMKSTYSPNTQACYKYILGELEGGLVQKVATKYFTDKEKPLAKILGKPYEIKTEAKIEKKDKPLSILNILHSPSGIPIPGMSFMDTEFRAAHEAYSAIFKTVALGFDGIVRTGKAAWKTAEFGGKVVSKASNAANNIVSFSRKAAPVASGSPRTPSPTP
ncbi:MAG: hypothetical protein WCK98_00765 [bacterium]